MGGLCRPKLSVGVRPGLQVGRYGQVDHPFRALEAQMATASTMAEVLADLVGHLRDAGYRDRYAHPVEDKTRPLLLPFEN